VNKRIFIALTIVFTGACAFLFNSFYKEAKNTAISKLNEEQMIHARQAALGIEDFFATWTRDLNSLSKMDEIIDIDAVGKHYMKLFYEANQEQISSITRVDESGVIIHNFPQSSLLGIDISNQKHVRELLRDHIPVISDVFKAVEGFDAVALHVPVFKGSVFKGSIGILINFESIAKRYLDVIKIGKTGYAWVVSRDGVQLYSPTPGFTGKSVFETMKDSPPRMIMVNDMLKGHEGTAIYTFDGTGVRNVGQIREYAVYMPVHVGSTFWSIAVASAEQDVLSGLISFRNKLAFVICTLFICGMVFSTLGAKAWFIVKEEEKRKQAEKKLQESEQVAEKFSTLFHAAPFAMSLAATPDGVLYDVNQAWLDLAGFIRKEDVIGKTSVELGVIREEEQRERLINEFRQHGSVRNQEIATFTRAGTQLALLVNLDWVDIGGHKFILSSMQDITGRKEAEVALSMSREWFRTTLGSIGDAVIATDASGRITFINPIASKLTGWELEDAVGQPVQSIFQIINEQTRQGAENIVERVLRAGCIVNLANHTALISREGREIPIEDSAAPIKDSAGNIIGVVLVFHDVTEKRRAQEALEQSEEHYRSLFDNMLDGYAYCKMLFEEEEPKDFIYLNVNRAFETLTGLKNVIGKNVSEVIPGIRESDSELIEIYGRVAKTGVPEQFERYLEALGMWFSISIYSPRKEHFVAVFDVITERKQMEQQLRSSHNELDLRVRERTAELSVSNKALIEYAAKLEKLNEELQDFAFVAAHDLQEPLRKIQTFCDMAQKRCVSTLDSTGQEYLDRVIASASRMRQLVSDLLQFSRAASISEPFEAIDLVKAALEAADVFEDTIKETAGLIEIETMPQIDADEIQILRIFQNLIDNALKFRSEEPPRIVVYAKQDGTEICEIFVKDNGIGFDQKYAERIFKPFQKLHRRNEYAGTGIGLTICRKIAERHGGSIRAESEPGKGSTFIIRLPVKQYRLEAI